MNSDAAFISGISHRICQDYALADANTIIVCDGCSSAKDTDIGARLLARSLLNTTVQMGEKYFNSAIVKADSVRQTLNLHRDCLFATALYAKATEDKIYVKVIGDGTVVLRTTDGIFHIWDIVFPSGAPFYLRYDLDERDRNLYYQKFGDETKSVKVLLNNYTLDKDGKSNLCCDDRLWYKSDQDICSKMTFNAKNYDLVALFSDGVHSFHKQEKTETGVFQQKVDFIEIIKELTDFKGHSGEFVQRRLNKSFKKFHELGWQNTDDVSIAAIYWQN